MILTLSACQTVPPMNYDFTPDQVVRSDHKTNGRLQSIEVMLARPEVRTGSITPDDSDMQPIIREWQRALTVSVNRSSMFDSNSDERVKLVVQILEFKHSSLLQLLVGRRITHINSRYIIIKSDTNTVLSSMDIESTGYGMAVQGELNMSIASYNNAVSSNIEKFIAVSNGVKP